MQSILQILVMEKGNVWIGYLWHVFDIDRIKFTPDMIFLTGQTIELSNDRLAMSDTFSLSLDNMYL